MNPIEVGTTEEAADSLYAVFDSRELRTLASNLDVSRERGDTARQTAGRIASQAPTMTAKIIEADREVAVDASGFRREREVGRADVSVAEAVERASSDRLAERLRGIRRALPPAYEARVRFTSDGLVSVTEETRDGIDISVLVDNPVHAIFTERGSPRLLNVGGKDYMADATAGEAIWCFHSRLERLYDPSE